MNIRNFPHDSPEYEANRYEDPYSQDHENNTQRIKYILNAHSYMFSIIKLREKCNCLSGLTSI